MPGKGFIRKNKYLIGAAGALTVLVLVVVTLVSSLGPDYKAMGAPEGVTEYSYLLSSNGPEIALDSFSRETYSEDRKALELTVYETNLALIKEVRELDLEEGLNLVEYRNVSSKINPSSVLFKDLSYPSTFVVEQSYEYDLASKTRLLEKYIDKQINVVTEDGASFTGTLLSYSDGIMLGTTQGIELVNSPLRVSFPGLPAELKTKPALVWKLYTQNPGKRPTETTYLTRGLGWKADYIAQVNASDTSLDLSGWVTLQNSSGVTYPNAGLTLLAGEVHTVSPAPYPRYARGVFEEEAMAMPAIAPEMFQEEGIFEYHAYKLGRETTIKDNETKQISLMSEEDISVKKEFVYDSQRSEEVRIMLEFTNSEGAGLGTALPKGVIRVYKEDSVGQLQFIGEDYIDHTPRDEEIRIYVGNAFDMLVERTMTESDQIRRNCYKQSFKIEATNRKDHGIELIVVEHLPRNAEIVTSSHSYDKKDAFTIEFKVLVSAGGTTTITYTEEHCW